MSEERQNQIEQRAYSLWEAEGRPTDRAHAHWHQAEAEVEASDQSAATTPVGGQDVASDAAPSDLLAVASPAATALPSGRKKKR